MADAAAPNGAPAPAHPDLSRPPAETPRQTTPTIYMTPEQYAAQQAEMIRLQGVESAVKAQLEQADQQRLKALAEKGQIEQALTEQRSAWEQKHAEAITAAARVEAQWLDEKSNAAIAEALAGRTFVGKDPARTAAMIRRLLAEEIEAIKGPDGRPLVRDRSTLRPAAEYLRERLDGDDFAPFFGASNRGGSGSDGTRSQAQDNGSTDPTGDYMKQIREMRARAIADPSRIFTG